MISLPGSCVWALRNGRTNTWDLASLVRFSFPLRPPREAYKDFAPMELVLCKIPEIRGSYPPCSLCLCGEFLPLMR
jgi:hypothetical protein